jgi:hypothetical protein
VDEERRHRADVLDGGRPPHAAGERRPAAAEEERLADAELGVVARAEDRAELGRRPDEPPVGVRELDRPRRARERVDELA